MEQPRLLNTAQAAEQLGIHPQTVYNRVNDGSWPCTRFGRKIKFTQAQVDQIIKIQEVAPVTSVPRRRKAS